MAARKGPAVFLRLGPIATAIVVMAGSGVVVAGPPESAPVATEEAPIDPEPGEQNDREAAVQAVARAREAARDGDFETALTEFERAQQLRPSPKLHYNVAVCHQRLMLRAREVGDEQAEREHARGALDAYRLYLEDIPDAKDRPEVEAEIEKLSVAGVGPSEEGGSTAGEDPPQPASFHDEWEALEQKEREEEQAAAPATTPKKKPKDKRLRGRIGLAGGAALVQPARLAGNDEVEGLPGLGAGLYGGAYLGKRRRLNLGSELWAYGSLNAAGRNHGLTGGHIGLTLDHSLVFGKKRRFELGLGGMVAIMGQTLRRRGLSNATCPTTTSSDDNAISQRGGLLLSGRIVMAVLLGRRRRHALALRVSPGLALLGEGSKDDREVCESEDSPFEEFGLSAGGALSVLGDLGYAARF
jgi:tetratricopeptide (TPR) repeat protein